jgi:hypothetical protein
MARTLVDGYHRIGRPVQPLRDLVRPEAQAARTDRHHHLVVRRTDRRQRSSGDRVEHGVAALDPRHAGLVEAADVDLGHAEIGHGALTHAALTERGQHVGDVVEERPVRPDDEHTFAGEPAAVLEHQIGRPVEGDRRLAGARAALDDQHLIDRRPDHHVLLRLDRRDDLAHRPGAFGADLGEHRVGDAARHVGGVRVVEVLVEVGGDIAAVALDGALEREPSAQRHAERVGGRGAVERGGDRCSPIDHHRLVVIILDVPAADVPLLPARSAGHRLEGVDPPEEVSRSWRGEVGECLLHRHLDVLGGDVVGGALRVDALEALHHALTGAAGEGEVGALGVELGKERDGRARAGRDVHGGRPS